MADYNQGASGYGGSGEVDRMDDDWYEGAEDRRTAAAPEFSGSVGDAGYGGVIGDQSEPRPQHKLHSSHEPLPKPAVYGAPKEEEEFVKDAPGETDRADYGAGGSSYEGDVPAAAPNVEGTVAGPGLGAHDDDTTSSHGAKKESFMTKLKEKLPGNHGSKSTDA